MALVFSCILSSKPSLVCEQAGLVHRHNLMMTESVESVELTSHGFDCVLEAPSNDHRHDSNAGTRPEGG